MSKSMNAFMNAFITPGRVSLSNETGFLYRQKARRYLFFVYIIYNKLFIEREREREREREIRRIISISSQIQYPLYQKPISCTYIDKLTIHECIHECIHYPEVI